MRIAAKRRRMSELGDILDAVDENPTQAAYVQAHRQIRGMGLPPSLSPCRVAILSNFTASPLEPCLVVEALKLGIAPEVYMGDFGQIEEVLLHPEHELHKWNPDIVFVILHADAYFEDLALEPTADFSPIDKWMNGLKWAVGNYSDGTGIPVVCSNLALPGRTPAGILDRKRGGVRAGIAAANEAFRKETEGSERLHVLDLAGCLARVGLGAALDPRMALIARMPFTHAAFLEIASDMCRFLWALKGLTKKCLVLDLDDTIWGGVLGEEGPSGIALGDEAPGSAYKRFQKVIKGVKNTGILLAACSKNNESDAIPVLESHPEMILRKDDFAAFRINWRDKAGNIRELAEELNIGLDSMVFVDDDPRERELIRQQTPEVHVHDLPDDPALFADSLLNSVYFERLALTPEDTRRTEMYHEQEKREVLREGAASFEDYLRSLDLAVDIREVDDADFARVYQLTAKTNQFNVTTVRYSEAELRERMAAPDYNLYCLRVSDRFGDSGLTGVAVLKSSRDTCEIESFLLSCRVLGRTVETAFLAFLSEQAERAGCKRVKGLYRPTPKSKPAENLYGSHGFELEKRTAHGEVRWTYDLGAKGPVAFPSWISR